MQTSFVLIFRQGNRILSAEEQQRRTVEVREWAMRQIKQHGLEPMVLGDESQIVGDGVISRGEGRVLAFNFIEADEMAEAVKIANTHPGLRYGVTIEVRPWTDPRTGGAPLSSGEPLARR